MEEVARSIRVGSTSPPEHFMLAGFAAGEGSFSITTRRPPFKDGTPRLRFCFDVTVAARDRQMLERLRDVLGFGSIADRHPLRAGWQPTSELRIASMHAHKTATIPFFDSFLPVSNKRAQYEHWRDALLAWDEEHPSRFGRGPSPCSVEGCTRPVRGRDLCRRHYYRVTGY